MLFCLTNNINSHYLLYKLNVSSLPEFKFCENYLIVIVICQNLMLHILLQSLIHLAALFMHVIAIACMSLQVA